MNQPRKDVHPRCHHVLLVPCPKIRLRASPRLSPRSHPRSPAKPPAGGADRIVACGRRKIASARGPHSRSFAREPPAPDFRLTARTSPILAGRVRGARGPQSPLWHDSDSFYDFLRQFQAARAVPHTARPSPGLAAERVRHRPIGRKNNSTPLSARRHRRAARHCGSLNDQIPGSLRHRHYQTFTRSR